MMRLIVPVVHDQIILFEPVDGRTAPAWPVETPVVKAT
jgi:hypothetical protein